jgi:RNA polymerase sigma factor (sigma-70 family)
MEANELYKKLKHLVSKNGYYSQVVNKSDREEILHTTYIRIWDKMNKGLISNEWDEIKDYCFISLKNRTLEHLRTKKNNNTKLEYMDHINSDLSDEDEYEEDTEEKIEIIKEIIKNDRYFNDDDRVIFMDRLYGMKRIEIAIKNNLSEDTVINSLRTTYKRIRQILNLKNGYKTNETKKNTYVITDTITKITNTYVNKSILAKDYGLTRRQVERLIKEGELNNYKIDVTI